LQAPDQPSIEETSMVSQAREYSLERHLLEHLKFGGMQKENLADLVNIVASLKNKYGIVPFAAAVQGEPIRYALTAISRIVCCSTS
jgi:hypothetical protein